MREPRCEILDCVARMPKASTELLDAAGNNVGKIIALADTSGEKALLRTMLSSIVFLGVLVLGSLGALFWRYLGRVESEVRASKERFVQAAELTGEVIWEVDPEARFTFISSACSKLLGYASLPRTAPTISGSLHSFSERQEPMSPLPRTENLPSNLP